MPSRSRRLEEKWWGKDYRTREVTSLATKHKALLADFSPDMKYCPLILNLQPANILLSCTYTCNMGRDGTEHARNLTFERGRSWVLKDSLEEVATRLRSWNIRGLGDDVSNCRMGAEVIRHCPIDIVYLKEMKQADSSLGFFRAFPKHNFLFMIKNSCGATRELWYALP